MGKNRHRPQRPGHPAEHLQQLRRVVGGSGGCAGGGGGGHASKHEVQVAPRQRAAASCSASMTRRGKLQRVGAGSAAAGIISISLDDAQRAVRSVGCVIAPGRRRTRSVGSWKPSGQACGKRPPAMRRPSKSPAARHRGVASGAGPAGFVSVSTVTRSVRAAAARSRGAAHLPGQGLLLVWRRVRVLVSTEHSRRP